MNRVSWSTRPPTSTFLTMEGGNVETCQKSSIDIDCRQATCALVIAKTQLQKLPRSLRRDQEPTTPINGNCARGAEPINILYQYSLYPMVYPCRLLARRIRRMAPTACRLGFPDLNRDFRHADPLISKPHPAIFRSTFRSRNSATSCRPLLPCLLPEAALEAVIRQS
ncbi:hypothetical protein IQ06DRAFT_95076 [Phaeosphaeriaceae sp. SRC1lsM3a]|nr:hypothetical protein IQ06DRAFT_95076 [Stagonospora sp. SRC1lsM3a]